MGLTPENVQDFIKKKWRNQNCPRCEQVKWQLGEEDNFKGLIALGDDDSNAIGVIGQAFLPAVWVFCTNCGHIEWIGAKVIRRWLSDKDGAGGDG